MARYDDLNTSAIAYATFVSSILLLVIVLLVQSLTFNWILGEDERKLADSHYTTSDNEIAAQKAKLEVFEKVMVEVIPPAQTVQHLGGGGETSYREADSCTDQAGPYFHPEGSPKACRSSSRYLIGRFEHAFPKNIG